MSLKNRISKTWKNLKKKCNVMKTTIIPYETFGDVELNETKEIEIFDKQNSSKTFIVTNKTTVGEICWKRFSNKTESLTEQHWAIAEVWKEAMIERTLEYHESILQVYNDSIMGHEDTRFFIFRSMGAMFQIFTDKKIYEDIYKTYNATISAKLKLTQQVCEGKVSPLYYSKVFIRDERNEDATWEQKILLIMDKTLYFAPRYDTIVEAMEAFENGSFNYLKIKSQAKYQIEELEKCMCSTKFQLFCCTTANLIYNSSPVDDHCLCLVLESGLKLFVCVENIFHKKYWMCAMRLSKYGKQLRDNYRSFVKKQTDPNEYEYKKSPMPNESIRSHVAMDFSGSVGRIVEDPVEAQAIAQADVVSTRRSGRNLCRTTPVVRAAVSQLDHDVHLSQPWYHKNMTREQAHIVLNSATKDGVFLIRESKRTTDSHVLSFIHSGKTVHMPIASHMDPVNGRVCFTIDNGKTKFYDLLQLVEFYQLNMGCLPTRLMHYVDNNPNPIPQ